MLAVCLLVSTFRELIRNTLRHLYVDNNGVVYSVIRGSGQAPEINLMVGHFWLEMSELSCCPRVFRVESEANVADGPTRDSLYLLVNTFKAVQRRPKLQH